MTINRIINGELINIVLTPEELSTAYYEQQKIFDRQDIGIYIDDQYLENNDDITREQLEPLMPDIAEKYRDIIDNGAFDWWDVAEMAISFVREGEGV